MIKCKMTMISRCTCLNSAFQELLNSLSFLKAAVMEMIDPALVVQKHQLHKPSETGFSLQVKQFHNNSPEVLFVFAQGSEFSRFTHELFFHQRFCFSRFEKTITSLQIRTQISYLNKQKIKDHCRHI